MAIDKKKILMIEDDSFIVKMYRTKFEDLGFIFCDAGTGDRGMELARVERPDLVILDIVLPQKDGFQILKEIKKDSQLSGIPVLMLSNLGQEEEVEKGLALGAEDYLIKAHFTPSEVVERVKKMFQKDGQSI